MQCIGQTINITTATELHKTSTACVGVGGKFTHNASKMLLIF